jgi:hypothetical protein
MAGQFKVEVKGLKELTAKLDASPPIYAKPYREALAAAALDTEREAKRLAPVDTGRFRAGITNRLDPRPLPRYAEIVATAPHSRNVIEGRKPGRRPPPFSALTGWARRHGFSTDNGALIRLARAIGRRGIKPRPVLTQALAAMPPKVNRRLQDAARGIERAWGRK